QLQPQVLPGLAPTLLLRRALDRPAALRARVPAGRIAAHPAGAVGPDGGPRGEMRIALGLLLGALVLTPLAAARGDALHLVEVGQFDRPTYVASFRGDPSRLYVVEKVGRIRVMLNGRTQA